MENEFEVDVEFEEYEATEEQLKNLKNFDLDDFEERCLGKTLEEVENMVKELNIPYTMGNSSIVIDFLMDVQDGNNSILFMMDGDKVSDTIQDFLPQLQYKLVK